MTGAALTVGPPRGGRLDLTLAAVLGTVRCRSGETVGGLCMLVTVGFIKAVAIRNVWPTEHADFTPWLQAHISELDNVLGLGLTNPQREVGAGDFSIDLVAETNLATS